ncbi:hypothetical protein HDF16_002903 [Granulicella aggregans]|uniref:Uncharacterized protein n=1 Tax=Granulicella aggregans TaxID=474949 RepID=A0A7W8E4D4_9BACT|nr:hypothetical protein [Granulicella aggregans]MBB5058189.1 hypothetical protein [Granulicella aggregans]
MRPSEIKSLSKSIEAVRVEMASVRQDIQNVVRAAGDQKTAQYESYKSIEKTLQSLPISEDVRQNERTEDDTNQRLRHRQNISVQVVLTIGTWLAFIAAGIYADIAWKQKRVMDDTFGEIQKQTLAAEQSAEASDRSSIVSQRAERESERQNELARRDATVASDAAATQATLSLKATQDIANATHDASESTIASSQASTMAYIYPHLGVVDDLKECTIMTGSHNGPKRWCFTHFSYKNFGQTPALNIRITGFVRDSSNTIAPDPGPNDLIVCMGAADNTLAKDGEDHCELPTLDVDNAAINTMLLINRSMPDRAYYVRGFIDYDTIYPGKHIHSQFCMIYHLGFDPAHPKPPHMCPAEETLK